MRTGRPFHFLAEIPREEGRVSICEFRGMLVVASEFGPPRIISERADGTREVIVINADLRELPAGKP